MKKLNLLFFVFALFLVSCGPSTQDAIDFNNAIIDHQKRLLDTESQLINAISNHQTAQVDQIYKDYLTQIDNSIAAINDLKSFSKFDTFKTSALSLFTAYKEVITNEYAEVIKLYRIPTDVYTDNDDKKLNELTRSIDSKLEDALKNFVETQKSFATEFNFTLTDSGN